MTETCCRAIDLFCGAGGLSLGLVRAGFDVLVGADNWGPAVRTYSENFGHGAANVDLGVVRPADLSERLDIDVSGIDLVAGAPPCAGFSVQRIGSDEDARNDLVLKFADYVLHFAPRVFLMENVPGLLGKRGMAVAQRFEMTLRDGGYEVAHAVLNGVDYGVPQTRRRAFFWGWRKGVDRSVDMPTPTHRGRPSTVIDAIGDLPSPPLDHTPSDGDPLHRRTRLSALNLERLRRIPPGGGFEDLPTEMRVDCHKNGASRIGHRYVYGRLAADRPAGTITARFDSFTRGRFGHPSDDRGITLREGARLQTFPDDFTFVGTQEQCAALIGNAVPPLLAEAIGRALLGHLTEATPAGDDGAATLFTS